MVLQYKQAAEEQKAGGVGIPSFGKVTQSYTTSNHGARTPGNHPLPPSGSGKTTHSSNTKKSSTL